MPSCCRSNALALASRSPAEATNVLSGRDSWQDQMAIERESAEAMQATQVAHCALPPQEWRLHTPANARAAKRRLGVSVTLSISKPRDQRARTCHAAAADGRASSRGRAGGADASGDRLHAWPPEAKRGDPRSRIRATSKTANVSKPSAASSGRSKGASAGGYHTLASAEEGWCAVRWETA